MILGIYLHVGAVHCIHFCSSKQPSINDCRRSAQIQAVSPFPFAILYRGRFNYSPTIAYALRLFKSVLDIRQKMLSAFFRTQSIPQKTTLDRAYIIHTYNERLQSLRRARKGD